MIKELTDNDFWQEVEKSSVPLIVDFWAIWSQSCMMVSQTIEELSKKYDGKFAFGKVNVDNEIKTANDCDIQNIPTIIIYSNGSELERMIGTVTKKILAGKLKKLKPKKTRKVSK
ncbi:MAG TPA: thioredoxin domain-containing protein [bacterium]|jgi:thioredoxin 1